MAHSDIRIRVQLYINLFTEKCQYIMSKELTTSKSNNTDGTNVSKCNLVEFLTTVHESCMTSQFHQNETNYISLLHKVCEDQ